MSAVQEIAILSPWRKIFVVAICFFVLSLFVNVAAAQQRSIVIKVINGKTGKPIANARLVLFGGKSQREAMLEKQNLNDATTGADGAVVYQIDPSVTGWIQVFIDGRTPCFDKPNSQTFSIGKVIRTGESTPNKCGVATLQNVAGTFVVYAREATLWEKMQW